MVLIVHLDKSILFLEYKNILISFFFFWVRKYPYFNYKFTTKKYQWKKKISTEQLLLLFIMVDDFCANWYIPRKTFTNQKNKGSLKAPIVAN